MKNILIIGANSAIAQAFAKRVAPKAERLFLVARDSQKLEAVASDLQVRFPNLKVGKQTLDVVNRDEHTNALQKAADFLEGAIDVALIAHGTLPDQKACESDVELALREIEINAVSVVSLLTSLANHFERQQSGSIAVISSVAGDRGRPSNYVYGASKGMVTLFLQGLRARLFKKNVHVLTIKPGFVDTPMTEAFDKGFLWAKPEKIAKDIHKGIRCKKSEIYTPWFWCGIMSIIKSIPEFIFKRMKL